MIVRADNRITITGAGQGVGARVAPSRRLLSWWVLTLASFAVGIVPTASAQFAEQALVLSPDFGGPNDAFTATYDVNAGGCRDPDGKMVHFYWFGETSSITVMGKVPLVKCVASVNAVPPPGTPPGQYTVGADLFFPGGPQRPQNGTYRVDSKPRPRSPSSTHSPGSPSSVTGPEAVAGAPGGAARSDERVADQSPGEGNGGTGVAGVPGDAVRAGEASGQFPGAQTIGSGGVAGAGAGTGGSSLAPGDAAPLGGLPEPSNGRQAASGTAPACAMQEVDCRAEALGTAAHRRNLLPLAFALVLFGAGAAFARTGRPNAADPEQARVR